MSNSYTEQAVRSKPKSGGVWLELLISGLVVYIVAAGAGLVLIMFPDATRRIVGDIRQAILQYTPQSSKPRLPIIEPPPVAEKSPARKAAPRPAHLRPAAMPAKRNFGVQIINATQPEPAVRTSPAVTVSIRDDQPVQTANAPARPSIRPAE